MEGTESDWDVTLGCAPPPWICMRARSRADMGAESAARGSALWSAGGGTAVRENVASGAGVGGRRWPSR